MLPPLTVETLVNGGSGLVRHDGRVVFIPDTAVGDTVVSRVTKEKKHYSEAQLVEILKPGPQRREPHCPVAGECGGCQWQHLNYSEQLEWKYNLFRDTLIHHCKIDEQKIQPICAAGREWHYRSRAQIKCHYTDDGFITGFYRPKSRFVVTIEHCPILAPELNLLLQALRSLLAGSPFADKIPQIDLAVDDKNKCALTVHYLGGDQRALIDLLRSGSLNSDILLQAGRKKRLKVIQGDGLLQLHVDQARIKLNYAVGSFAQINLVQNRQLIDTVISLADLSGSEQIMDLYCGMGNFSLPLAKRCKSVMGIEESPLSVEWARKNAELNRLNNTRFICGSVDEELKHGREQGNIDLLLLDPPRTGAYNVMKSLIEHPVDKIIYVSCDQQTLARDLKVLVNHGYQLTISQPFDMFPQTYHCESVTLLRRERSA